MESTPSKSRFSPSGKVFLVGAGPGDPGLITLRALHCLQSADVVLFDGLVNPEILSHLSPAATAICVGKHGQARPWTQPEIDDALVEQARLGKVVVRLKGGDPAIFARSAEELDRLTREQIPFEVVPGITAALAASSYTGIPITHRDWASAVAFVTSHSQSIDGGHEAEESLDWNALAKFPGTLVFYMGAATAKDWTSRLIQAGKPPQTPAAIVRKCSLPDQEVIYCRLEEVASHFTHAGHPPPAITIVGQVVPLGTTLDWFAKRPLFGQRVLWTRPRHESDSLLEQLQERGAHIIRYPVIEIEPTNKQAELDRALLNLQEWKWVVFLSRHGVEHTMRRLGDLGLDARAFAHNQFATIGPGTRDALASWNLRSDLMPTDSFDGEGLAKSLNQQVERAPILILRANRGRTDWIQSLEKAGHRVDVVECYRQVDVVQPDPKIWQSLHEGNIDWITVTSTAIANNLVNLFGEELKRAKMLSISPAVSTALRQLGYEVSFELSSNPSDLATLHKWFLVSRE